MPTMATQLPPSMQNAFSRGYIKAGPGQSGCHSILYIYSWKRLIAISLTTWLLLRSGHVYPSLIMPRKKMGEHRAWGTTSRTGRTPRAAPTGSRPRLAGTRSLASGRPTSRACWRGSWPCPESARLTFSGVCVACLMFGLYHSYCTRIYHWSSRVANVSNRIQDSGKGYYYSRMIRLHS